MAPQIRLGRHELADLEAIRDLDPADLSAVAERLRAIKPPPLGQEQLGNAITAALPGNEERSDPLVRVVLSLHGIMRQSAMKLDDLLQAISGAIDRDAKWTDTQRQAWRNVEPALRELLSVQAVRLVSKAIHLSFEYTHLLRTARILTDIRPLYDDDATLIEGAVVSHTLRLWYESVEGIQSLAVAMDETDIMSLADQCARALRKARLARDLLSEKASIPTLISGDNQSA